MKYLSDVKITIYRRIKYYLLPIYYIDVISNRLFFHHFHRQTLYTLISKVSYKLKANGRIFAIKNKRT